MSNSSWPDVRTKPVLKQSWGAPTILNCQVNNISREVAVDSRDHEDDNKVTFKLFRLLKDFLRTSTWELRRQKRPDIRGTEVHIVPTRTNTLTELDEGNNQKDLADNIETLTANNWEHPNPRNSIFPRQES